MVCFLHIWKYTTNYSHDYSNYANLNRSNNQVFSVFWLRQLLAATHVKKKKNGDFLSGKSFEAWFDKAVISDQQLPHSDEQLCNYAFKNSLFKDSWLM